MVKLQKPVPKKLDNKPKLDNPIKKKKQQLNKEKSTGSVKNIKTKLLESPIKEAKQVKLEKKPLKESPPKKKEASKAKKPQKESKSEVKPLSAPVTQIPKQPKEPKEVPAGKKDKKPKTQNKNEQKQAVPIKTVAPVKPLPPTKTVPAKKVVLPTTKPAPLKKSVPSSNKQTPESTIKPPKSEQIKKKKNKKSTSPVEGATPVVEPKVDQKVVQLQAKKKSKISFKKAKVTAEARPWRNKDKKEKKDIREANAIRYEPLPFDEEKFNAIVNVENIRKIAEALKKQVENEVAAKKKSIFEDYRYFLQIGSFKIANCPKRMVKLNLKHSLVDKDDDVLLVVPDQQRGAKADYEPTLHHYEDLLRSQGVEGITIMPMNQLRKEFRTFEQKRRLCASYEHFLCDGRIVSHVVGVVGKIGQKPRHTFHAVRMEDHKNIKNEIEKALRKTAFRQLAKSSLHAIPVGSHKFTAQQVADNVSQVVEQLKKLFPGGLSNVRNLYLKIDLTGTSALPLYLSMAQAPEQTPMVMGPREQRMIKLKREANEVLTKFAMTKEGKLIKLTKPEVEKKRKLQEMKAALKEDNEVAAKKAKKTADKEQKEEVKDLELPENEEDDDEESSDEDDDEDDVVQFEGSSDDDEEEMAQSDQGEDDEEGVDVESETEILENGLVEEDDEESGEEDQQNVNESDEEDDDDDDDDEEGNDDDDDEEEESD